MSLYHTPGYFMYRLNNTVSDASIELFKVPSSNYQSSIYTNPLARKPRQVKLDLDM
jgi:hypothetical protein